MPQVISRPHIIQQTITTQAVQGEVTVNINLTITVNQDGSVQVNTNQKKEKDIYAIPEFESGEILSNFGEEIK